MDSLTEQPAAAAGIETPAPPPVHDETPTSIADHKALYSPDATAVAAREAESKIETPQAVTEQAAPPERRLRSKEAVKRIDQLTSRAKTAEERFADAESRVASLERELTQLRRDGAPRQEIRQAEQRVEAAQTTQDRVQIDPQDPPPDKKTYQDYEDYIDDRAAWRARQEYKAQRQQDHQAAQEQASSRSWYDRVEAAKKELADYEAVAFTPVMWADNKGNIMPGCEAIDAFINEDDTGAKVLYHLQAHPDESSELVRMSPLQQIKRLSLLSQRFSPNPSTSAGRTGSAPGRQVNLPPRPPNPVRAEAQRVGDAPPPTDGSLSIAEHSRRFAPQSRRR